MSRNKKKKKKYVMYGIPVLATKQDIKTYANEIAEIFGESQQRSYNKRFLSFNEQLKTI